jgi:hypothetical protein
MAHKVSSLEFTREGRRLYVSKESIERYQQGETPAAPESKSQIPDDSSSLQSVQRADAPAPPGRRSAGQRELLDTLTAYPRIPILHAAWRAIP